MTNTMQESAKYTPKNAKRHLDPELHSFHTAVEFFVHAQELRTAIMRNGDEIVRYQIFDGTTILGEGPSEDEALQAAISAP